MQSRIVRLAIAILIAALALVLIRAWVNSQVTTTLKGDIQTEPTEMVVVATQAIPSGTALSKDNVTIKEIPASMVPDGHFKSVDEVIADAEGRMRFAIDDIAAKEVILKANVTDPASSAKLSEMLPPGFRAVSIRVNDVQGVAGFVFPGDLVDVLLTRPSGCDDSGKACVMVLLAAVKVLAIDQSAVTTADAPAVAKSVTLAVSAEDAQTLVLGGSLGQLSLALRDPGATDSSPPQTLMEGQLGQPRAEPLPAPAPATPPVTPAVTPPAAAPAPASDQSAPAPEAPPPAAAAPAPETPEVRVLRGTEWQSYPMPR